MPIVQGTRTVVNTLTDGAQLRPAIARLADGGWVVTWESLDPNTDEYNVRQQRFNESGNPVGGEAPVNTTTLGSQYYPAITALDDGGWVVAWESSLTSISSVIDQQRFDNEGKLVGVETLVANENLGSKGAPAIAKLADGGWVVVWTSRHQDGDQRGIYQQRFDDEGNPVGVETLVNTHTLGDQFFPEVTALDDGGWVVAWISRDDYDQPGVDIRLQRFDDKGDAVGGEVQVNTNGQVAVQVPAITALGDGGWLVAWEAHGEGGTDADIYLRRFDDKGNAIGDEVQVNAYDYGHQVRPEISALANGGWVVTWFTTDPDTYSSVIHQQTFDATGKPIGNFGTVESHAAVYERSAAITGLDDGRWVVTWERGEDIDQQVFHYEFADPTGTPTVQLPDGIEDKPYTGSLAALLENIADPDGGSLFIESITADHGTVSIDRTDGTFTLIPDVDYYGPVTLTYTVTDDNGGRTAGFMVSFEIAAVEDTLPPVPPIGGSGGGGGRGGGGPGIGGIGGGSNDDGGDGAGDGNDSATGGTGGSPAEDPDVFVITLSNDSVAENARKGAVVGRFVTTGGQQNELSLSLGTTGSADLFVIVNNELRVKSAGTLDFETTPVHLITVIATDASGNTFETEIEIRLIDVEESPRGTRQNDRLVGDALDNILDGRKGNDKLIGNAGADTFVFGRSYGRDKILDFNPEEGDRIDLSKAVGIRGFRDLMKNHLEDTGAHVRITPMTVRCW